MSVSHKHKEKQTADRLIFTDYLLEQDSQHTFVLKIVHLNIWVCTATNAIDVMVLQIHKNGVAYKNLLK